MENTASISDSCGLGPGLENSLVSLEWWVWILGADDEIAAIIERLQQLDVEKCGATHCTGDRRIAAFQQACGDTFVEMGTARMLAFTAADE